MIPDRFRKATNNICKPAKRGTPALKHLLVLTWFVYCDCLPIIQPAVHLGKECTPLEACQPSMQAARLSPFGVCCGPAPTATHVLHTDEMGTNEHSGRLHYPVLNLIRPGGHCFPLAT